MERDHLENLDVNGRIISEWILEKWCGKLYSELHLVQVRVQ